MDFRVGRRWLESFIAGAHPPVLFMKCIVSNQNLFEFHPCLAREARGGAGFGGSVTSRAV